MSTEYEATFYPIDIPSIQEKLKQLWYVCIQPEYLQTRATFSLPSSLDLKWWFARVRVEADRTTLSIKQFLRNADIYAQKECELVIDDYETWKTFLKTLWCLQKAIQKNKRELWKKDDIYIMIDQRPFIQPLLEIEWLDVVTVKRASSELWYAREEAIFDSVTEIYARVYNISHEQINNQTPNIEFDMQNPFL